MSCGCGNKSNNVKTVSYKGGEDSCGTGLHWKNILGIPECITDCDALLNFITNNFSGSITPETDPTVPSWVKSITETNISNWNTAFGWGDHSGLYVPLARTVSAGNGLTGGGALSSDITISHGDTSSVSNANLTGAKVVAQVIFDDFGHVTALSTRDLTPEDIGAMPAGTIPGTPTLQQVTTQGATTSVLSSFLGGLSVSNSIVIPTAGSISKSGTGLKITSGNELQFVVPTGENISFYRNTLATNIIYADGRMAGANAVNDNEFVTKGQLDAIVIEPGDNIVNQFTSSQLDANFWISGSGRIGGTLFVGLDDMYKFDGTEVLLGPYPSNRDDTVATTPVNFLYTDLNGKLLSSPMSELPIIPSTRQIIAGAGLAGGGDLSNDVTLEHGDTSSISNLTTSGAEVIGAMTFDPYGHVQNITTRTLTAANISAVPTSRTILMSAGNSGITISPTTAQNLSSNRTWQISHGDTSSLNGQLITVGEVLESITVDSFGHVTAFTTAEGGSGIPNLQAVTDQGSNTTDIIQTGGLVTNHSDSAVSSAAFGYPHSTHPSIHYSNTNSRWVMRYASEFGSLARVAGDEAVNGDEFITLDQLESTFVSIDTGSWTPTLRGYRGPSTGDGSPSLHTVTGYTVDSAIYYKFGAMVYLLMNITWEAASVSVSDGGALLEVSGLPFKITTAGTSSYLSNRGIIKLNSLIDEFYEILLVQHQLSAYGQVAEFWNRDASYMRCDFLTGVGAGTWQFSVMINYMSDEV